MSGEATGGGRRVPSSRTIATIAFIVVTAVLILELGIWYFAGLILLYVALDISQRLQKRRDARTEAVIAGCADRTAQAIIFKGLPRHCERAAWIARKQGWLAMPICRERFLRRSTKLVPTASASSLAALLGALHEDKLITRLHLPDELPNFEPAKSAGKKRPNPKS